MKFRNIKLIGGMSMALMLATTSCRDDTFSDYWDNGSDEMTVNIHVGLEGMSASRAGVESVSHIGDGSKIDMLVYAVYYDAATDKDDPDHTPVWEAATEYVKEYEDSNAIPFGGTVKPGHGQTILDVSNTLQKGDPQPITLTLKKGQDYRVVFWAQNHETQAFVIDDFNRVQMKYKVLEEENVKDEDGNDIKDDDGNDVTQDHILSVNNDESRDAFCRSIPLSGNQPNRDLTIYLRRPVAQINVGTHGFDFESITRNSTDGDKYLYSKIRINRAARYLDVVNDKIYTTTINDDDPNANTTEAFYTIDYEYEKIPAYWQMDIPKYPSYTIHDLNEGGAYNTFLDNHEDDESFKNAKGDTPQEKFNSIYGKEEFLKVRLFDHTQDDKDKYGDGKEFDYIPYEPMGSSLNTNESNQNRSEVFKYLSMCYVLTNSSDNYQDVLTNVKVWLAKDKNGKDEVEVANLTQVPVQRNHRTNIVGSLLTAKATMSIVVDQDFAGRKIHGDDEILSGEITEGFYYDAKNDEFQISSLNGLLFFQQLVNGDLTVRQIHNLGKGASYGSPYPYYDPEKDDLTTLSLKYQSHSYSELGSEKANIIMRGSKYYDLMGAGKEEKNGNDTWRIKVMPNDQGNWPQFNNFPFYGVKVKLMADINLSGIEWIPIGFDCVNWDTTLGDIRDDKFKPYTNTENPINEQPNVINYSTFASGTQSFSQAGEMNLGNRRVFCGTFDGNGHTIYNLTTKKFGANVHESAFQHYEGKTSQGGPYDCVQWFAYGFFGVVGPNAVIKDLRIQNVDIQGNNAVAAIVGQVNSLGFPAKIQNCVVDGGVIDAVPLYRGDHHSDTMWARTGARGCYIGGIVGQFVAKDNGSDRAEVSGCEVRNLTIQGYRRMGGIIGAIADQGTSTMDSPFVQLDIKVEDNGIRNSLLIVNQYRQFTSFFDYMNADGKTWQNGWGWGSGGGYVPMTDKIVGGYYSENEYSAVESSSNLDAFNYGNYHTATSYNTKNAYYNYVNSRNSVSNLQYCELSVQPDAPNSTTGGNAGLTATKRKSVIKDIPLKHIPMFTSLFTDEVTLQNNYYGDSNLHTIIKFGNRFIFYDYQTASYKFSLPISFPNGHEVNFDKNSPKTGMYVESVTMNGAEAPGGRSVITPNGVDGTNACVMYITARDRVQFMREKKTNSSDGTKVNPVLATTDKVEQFYRKPTVVKNVVLRGSPYAWAGIILAPNENMQKVEFDNVTIYDVYKTLSQEEEATTIGKNTIQNYTYWYPYTNEKGDPSSTDTQNRVKIDLKASNCNFRGYTVPGKGWNLVTYDNTTFEAGSETRYSYLTMKDENGNDSDNRNEFRTCKVEANTEFKNCKFKAPFYIDMSSKWQVKDSQGNVIESKNAGDAPYFTVTFDERCAATSAYKNVALNLTLLNDNNKQVCYVGVDKNEKEGKTVVTYYDKDFKEIK